MTDSVPFDESLLESRILARRVQASDWQAFRQLYERVLPSLHAWVHLRSRNLAHRVEPEDVLQEVWLRAFPKIHEYDAERSFRAWILGIARNVLLQSQEKAAARGAQVSDASESTWEDSDTSISLRLARDEARGQLLDYVSSMDPEDQTLLLHCGLEEESCAVVANRLGISVDAATKRWQVLRARLRQAGIVRALALQLEA